MKRILLVLAMLSALLTSWPARAAHVSFAWQDITSTYQTNRPVAIYPIYLSGSQTGVDMVTRDRILVWTGTNGGVTVSNLMAGGIRTEFSGRYNLTTNWFNVPSTNGLVNARDIVQTNAWGQLPFYTTAQIDQRLATITNTTGNSVTNGDTRPIALNGSFQVGAGLNFFVNSAGWYLGNGNMFGNPDGSFGILGGSFFVNSAGTLNQVNGITNTAGYYGTGAVRSTGGFVGPVNGTNVSGVGKVINVREPPFNAKGDGITDDSAAVQSALWYAALSNSWPSLVYLPFGDYLFRTHVQLPPNTSFFNNANNTGQNAGKNYGIIGDGFGSRILWTNNTGEALYAYVDQTVTTWTNWVNYIKLEKFSIVGPWLANPDLTNFNSGADGSAITAVGIRAGPTGALPSYPAVGNFWKLSGLKINGFMNGIAATNINWPIIEDCTIEFNTKNSILLAGTISPVIRRCALGTLIGTTWTNDVAAVSLENDAAGNIGNGTAIISDCLSGYNSLFVFCTNGRPLTVRDCGQEVSFRGFAELNANGSRASFDGIDYFASATALGFIIAYNRSLDGSKPGDDMSGWRIGNVWNWINKPLIYGAGWIPTWTHLPRVSVPDGNAGQYAYYQSGGSLTAIPSERMGQFNTSDYVYLPSVGETTEARIVARMGQEVGYGAIAGNLTRNVGQTTLGTMGGFNGYGWFEIKGTPATPAIGAIHYSLPKNQSSSTYNVILSALSTNTGQFAFWSGVHTYTNNTVVDEQGNIGDTPLTAGQVKQFNHFVVNSRPSWGEDGQTLYIYYYDVTNTVWLIDVQVESVIPYTSPTTNQGWRLPSRS